MTIDHAHEHETPLSHLPPEERAGRRRALLVALSLTSVFLVVEVLGGLLTGSLALLADAGHMLSDVVALTLSLGAFWLAARAFSPSRTYGFQRVEILAALINGLGLLVIAGWVLYEASMRLTDPPEVESLPMAGIAAAGLAVNLVSAGYLARHAGENLNLRGAFLHVVGDLLGSVGAIVAGVVIFATGWQAADPVVSIFIAALIAVSAARLIRDSLVILMEFAPSNIDPDEVAASICERPGVASVHDLHIWTVTSGRVALSAHVHLDGTVETDAVLSDLCSGLHERFGIGHVTIQPELGEMHDDGAESLPRCMMEFGDRHHEATTTHR